jgi:bifunctional DNase/RNase
MSATSTEGDAVEVDAAAASMAHANGDAFAQADTEAALPVSEDDPSRFTVPEQDDGESEPVTFGGEQGETTPGELAGPENELDELAPADEPVFVDELEVTPEPEAELDPLTTPPEMAQMLFVDVVLMLPATHPVVVLQEADPPFRELRIPVGGAEGIAIAYAARGVATPRPLTHELFTRVFEEFAMTLDVVRITEVRGSAFSAEMVISGALGARLIDCRPSDAIALALRQRLPVPIMASPTVLAVAGTEPVGSN